MEEEGVIAISQNVTSHMVEQADFRLAGDVTINVSGEHAITNIDLSVVPGQRYPISGFPRALMQKSPPIGKSDDILRDFLIFFSFFTSYSSYLKKKKKKKTDYNHYIYMYIFNFNFVGALQ